MPDNNIFNLVQVHCQLVIPVEVGAPELELEHVIPADEDDPAEDQDSRGDQKEHVADVQEPNDIYDNDDKDKDNQGDDIWI